MPRLPNQKNFSLGGQTLFKFFSITLFFLILAAQSPFDLFADDIRLTNDVMLESALVSSQNSGANLRIRQPDGVTIELPTREAVNAIVMQPQASDQYYAKVPFLPESIENQLKLALICRSQKLEHEAELHYKRVLELNPEQPDALMAMGYQKIGNSWVTREEEMGKLGYVQNKLGRWVTSQQLAIEENRIKFDDGERQMIRQIQNLIKRLNGPDSEIAKEELFSHNYPVAVRPILRALETERDAAIRDILVRALGNIRSQQATQELVYWSMIEPNEEVRMTCFSYLRKRYNVAPLYFPYLRNADNATVNRAGFALGQLGDKAAIPALIESLVSQHKTTITVDGIRMQATTTYGTQGSEGIVISTPQKKIVQEQVPNRDVLNALRLLTGTDYEFDVPAWRSWWVEQQQNISFDSRRGSYD